MGITSIESRLEATVNHAKSSEFTVIDDDEDDMPYIPPDFTIDDDDYDDVPSKSKSSYNAPPEFTVDDDDDFSYSESSAAPRVRRPKRKTVPTMQGTNWMQKNAKFSNEPAEEEPAPFNNRRGDSPRNERGPPSRGPPSRGPPSRGPPSRDGRGTSSNNFRENFRATRVFVQGIPQGTSWQDLKDHFKVAGEVVFASVSVDMETGESRGHGIVQFEDGEMAQNAIEIMRDHPLNGSNLFVREDVQENKNEASLKPKGPTPPTKWKCANEENAEYLDETELLAIRTLIKARDDARRRKKYDVSDRIRDELKEQHGVFIDDRLKMWWTSLDGSKVPQSIQDVKGDGRWKLKAWRQIPTTPENDACVNPDMVTGLLNQRDVARREKDFKTADLLLDEARTCPDGELTLRIHDESRTWRVWTESRPVFEDNNYQQDNRKSRDPEDMRMSAADECLSIVEKHAPQKVEEIKMVLDKFKGREFQVLKRLKKQYEE